MRRATMVFGAKDQLACRLATACTFAHAQPGPGDAAAAPAQRAGDARALPGQVLRPKLPDHEEIRHAPEAGE